MLPLPPPLSALTNNHIRNGRIPSARYKQWKVDARVAMIAQLGYKPTHITGHVTTIYLFGRPDKRRRDAYNLEKGTSDFLKDQGIIEDDSLIDVGVVGWTDDHPGQVEIIIRPYDKAILNQLICG